MIFPEFIIVQSLIYKKLSRPAKRAALEYIYTPAWCGPSQADRIIIDSLDIAIGYAAEHVQVK